jgi:hypoxanthine phosphoribosyltransferase
VNTPLAVSDPTISCGGKRFRVYLTQRQIQERVHELGAQIAADYTEAPLLVGILKGSYVFLADLARAIGRPSTVDFMKVSSYGDSMRSSGQLRIELDLGTNISGRDVIIVEDIVDTGNTLHRLTAELAKRGPASLAIATLLHKTAATKHELDIRYTGFSIVNDFVIGYGLDFAEQGRELPQIYILAE